MEMTKGSSSFMFTWKVKNFSFCWQRELQFIERTFAAKGHQWSLILYPSTPINCVSCFLRKESCSPFEVDYELSFLDERGFPLRSIKVSDATFNKGSKGIQLWLHHDEIFGNKAALSPLDILSINCRMWTDEAPILPMGRYIATTEVKVQRCTFVWHIPEFKGLHNLKKRTEVVKHPRTGISCISFNFFLDEWNKYFFEISFLYPSLVEICKCQVFLLSADGERLKCGRFEVVASGETTDPDWTFQLSLSKRHLIKNKKQYLLNNTLSLECEVAFASEMELGYIQKQELDHQSMTSNEDTSNVSTSPPHDSNSLEEHSGSFDPLKDDYSTSSKANADSDPENLKERYPESLIATMNDLQSSAAVPSLAWKDDMLAMYKNGVMCDAELRTDSESFLVHSLVLSIRSPVFCDLLASGRRHIHLDDLDPDTVRRMTLFMYTDTLEISDCEAAKRLYVAAHKYEIPLLLQKCLLFLSRNLEPSICCDLLPLADGFHDETLKQVVQIYITERAGDVIHLEQWKILEETRPRLMLDMFRIMYLKKL